MGTHRKRMGVCVCGGDIVKPLKNKEIWICLDCQVGIHRPKRKDRLFFTAEDSQRYLCDQITFDELLET